MAKIATTKDAFMDGAFYAVQPESGGHRSGVDALLLAAQVDQSAAGRAADLGSGSGVAGLSMAQRCSNLNVDLVESDPTMATLARQTIELTDNSGLCARMQVIEADVLAAGKIRTQCGLVDNRYDVVISNPPYNAAHLQRPDGQLKLKAHALEEGQLERWVKTSTSILKSGGAFHMILRPECLPDALNAMKNRMGNVSIDPIYSRSGEAAKRVIVSAIKGSKAPLRLLSGRVLHQKSGGYAKWAEKIFRGRH